MVKGVEKKIVIGDKVYLITLILVRDLYGKSGFEVKVGERQKGKRKWVAIELTSLEDANLARLWEKRIERTSYYIYCIKSRIPDIDKILQELKNELAESIKEQVLKIKL